MHFQACAEKILISQLKMEYLFGAFMTRFTKKGKSASDHNAIKEQIVVKHPAGVFADSSHIKEHRHKLISIMTNTVFKLVVNAYHVIFQQHRL